jgi:hypothetical protein
MDDIVKTFLSLFPEKWQIFFGVIVLLSLIIPKLLTLRDTWLSYRQGINKLSLEKQQLELLKIKYEIEALRKMHGLQEIPLPIPMQFTTTISIEQKAQIIKRRWWVKHPVIGLIIFRFLQIFLGFYGISFALFTIVSPFVLRWNEFGGVWGIIMLELFYALVTYGCYKGYKKIRGIVNKLRSETENTSN